MYNKGIFDYHVHCPNLCLMEKVGNKVIGLLIKLYIENLMWIPGSLFLCF